LSDLTYPRFPELGASTERSFFLEDPASDDALATSATQQSFEGANHPEVPPIRVIPAFASALSKSLSVGLVWAVAPELKIIKFPHWASWKTMRRTGLEVRKRNQAQLQGSTDCFTTIAGA